jgi:hypothetical protein
MNNFPAATFVHRRISFMRKDISIPRRSGGGSREGSQQVRLQPHLLLVFAWKLGTIHWQRVAWGMAALVVLAIRMRESRSAWMGVNDVEPP